MIDFPAVRDPYLGTLMVCSHLRTKDRRIVRKLRDLPSIKGAMFAEIRGKPDPVYAMAFGDGPEVKKSVHLHVNIVRPRPYGRTRVPEINSTREEIAAVLERFAGQSAYVTVVGTFFVPRRRIPTDGSGLIGVLLAEEEFGRITTQQTAGKISVKDGPVMEWMLRGDENELRIEVQEHDVELISQRYLVSSYRRVIASFYELTAVSNVGARASH